MAQLHCVNKAQKDIYENGKYIKRKNKKGKEVEVLDRSIPENKQDKILVKKGESYYWWQFRFGGKNISKERPARSRLTQSNFYSQLWDIEDAIGALTAESPEDLEEQVEGFKSDLENLKDECQSSLDNMPQHLQESSSSGELLTSRVDGLDEMINELDCIDFSFDEDASTQEDWLQEKIEDVQNIQYNGD